MDSTSAALAPDVRRRTIAVTNGKGGVGKTSCVTNLGCILAEAGYRVLLVDLDGQGNVSVNLGFDEDETNDKGQALAFAVQAKQAPTPLKNVRPNLDVLTAGEHTDQLLDILHGDSLRGGGMRGCVGRALAPIAPSYDLILIDTPPSDSGAMAVEEAMLASRWVIIPLKPEPKSVKGLYSVADRMQRVQTLNPSVQLLGVVLFGIPTGATRVEARPREILGERLADIAPVFTAKIRNVPAADADAVFRGQSVLELAADAKAQSPFWERLRNGASDTPRLASSASSLAEDYMQLAEEIITELSKQEEQLALQEAAQ